jgi:glycosyltransferase involved in cell wall biosynthesis
MPHGGVGSFTQGLATALVRRGHQVTVIGIYPVKRTIVSDDCGARVIRVPHSQIPRTGFLVNQLRLSRALKAVHRERPIDAIEGPEGAFAMIGKRFPAPKVIRMHGGHRFFFTTLGQQPRPWRSWLESRSFACADHLCAVSHFVANTTGRLLHLGNRPISVLPNPVDTDMFRPRADATEDPGLMVFVGAICEKKGIRQLVEAMPLIRQAVPDVRLHAYGRDTHTGTPPQSFMDTLRRLVPADMADRIIFKGAIERRKVPEVLARASVCVFPSHMEALPIAWLEAMSMGKAVIASRTGPGPEVIENGVSGLLCDPHDPRSIAQAATLALQQPLLRERLGQAARARVLAHFAEDVMVGRNESFYRECVGRSGA